MDEKLILTIPPEFEPSQLSEALAADYTIAAEQPVVEAITYVDTFDWRLFNKSLALSQVEDQLILQPIDAIQVLESETTNALPIFAEDFPDGALKNRLAGILKMRALLKMSRVYRQLTAYRVLDTNRKTVVRLVCEHINADEAMASDPFVARLRLLPVRGYRKPYRLLLRQLKSLGCEITTEGIYHAAMAAGDKCPGDYSSKLNIPLEPQMPAEAATKKIMRVLLNTLKINAGMIAQDLDTEFLHEYRVAIRRTRSALAQIKNVFPADITLQYKKDFATIGKMSNQLRDLDVYLLDEQVYKAKLPDLLRDNIDPLFEYLRRKRGHALQSVVQGLASQQYRRILRDWDAFIHAESDDSQTAPNAQVAVIDLARNRIFKRYRRIVKDGRKILIAPSDEKLHDLRIECKKLRYLMEFFAGLFARKKIKRLITQQKKLQNNLGAINDLYVQTEYLMHIAAELPSDTRDHNKVLLAIGSLVGTLDREMAAHKEAFERIFTAFAAPENEQLFYELFASKDAK